MTFTNEEKFYQQAAARCAGREYCRHDWQQKAIAAGFTAEQTERIVLQLTTEGFINDARYAKAFAHDKMHYDRWGRIKIRQALRMKGISSEIIENALENIDSHEYLNILTQIISSKERSMKAKTNYERRQKLARFAIGRGFEPHLVFDAIGDHEEEDGFNATASEDCW